MDGSVPSRYNPIVTLRAHVRNGRLVLDEPTDRKEGDTVELVPVDEIPAHPGDHDPVAAAIANAPTDAEPITEEERVAFEEIRSGSARLVPHAEVKRKLSERTR